jgi:hypothetical protein
MFTSAIVSDNWSAFSDLKGLRSFTLHQYSYMKSLEDKKYPLGPVTLRCVLDWEQ